MLAILLGPCYKRKVKGTHPAHLLEAVKDETPRRHTVEKRVNLFPRSNMAWTLLSVKGGAAVVDAA